MQKLTANQKVDLESRLKRSRDIGERNRLCVILGFDDGRSVKELASILRISQPTVYQYLNDFHTTQKTRHLLRGGRKPKLNDEQSEELKRHLQEVTYLKAKHVSGYVKQAFGVEISRSGMTAWLKANGFVFKCPEKVPGKVDPERQKAFVHEYECLKNGLLADEEIYFIDAVHPEHQSQAVRGWIQKGETKTLQSTGKQLRLHLAGALCLEPMKVITREYPTVDADAMLDFFKALEGSSKASKIYVILDNARANKNKKVEEYLKNSRIEARYLPPYSPNLNPIERLWKVMRETKLYNRYYESSVDFFGEIRAFFDEEVPRRINSWKSRLNDNFQKIELNPIQPAFF